MAITRDQVMQAAKARGLKTRRAFILRGENGETYFQVSDHAPWLYYNGEDWVQLGATNQQALRSLEQL